MKILENIIRLFLAVVIFCCLLYFTFIYKDVILSVGAKRGLRGKIAYTLGGRHIKVIELSSGKKKIIYSIPKEGDRYLGCVFNPSFSPEGRRMVFSKSGSGYDYRYKLYIMNSDGTDMEKFLDLDDVSMLSPSWSPDGEKIAFIARKSQRGGEGGLYIVDAENPDFISCVSNVLPSLSQPAWSPDSRKIAFNSEELVRTVLSKNSYLEVDQGGIYVVDIFDKNCKKIIDLVSHPSWSPDGKRLVCEGKKGYYIVDVDDFAYNFHLFIPYKRPPLGRSFSFPVRWSPDGKYIVFCKEIWPGFAGIGIYVVAIDNPKRHIRIATESETVSGMSWVK